MSFYGVNHLIRRPATIVVIDKVSFRADQVSDDCVVNLKIHILDYIIKCTPFMQNQVVNIIKYTVYRILFGQIKKNSLYKVIWTKE